MSLLHHYYGWADSLPEPPQRAGATPSAQLRIQKIPAHIADEIWASTAHLPLSISFLSWPVDEELSSTDATLKKGGITRAPLPTEAANLVWRQAEVKGENVRLDWSREGALAPPSEMRPPNQDVADLPEALQHRVTQGYYFSAPRRINLQEASVVKTEIKTLASEKIPARGMRRCFLNDSRVCVGSWGKSRSSSRRSSSSADRPRSRRSSSAYRLTRSWRCVGGASSSALPPAQLGSGQQQDMISLAKRRFRSSRCPRVRLTAHVPLCSAIAGQAQPRRRARGRGGSPAGPTLAPLPSLQPPDQLTPWFWWLKMGPQANLDFC